MYTEDRLSVVLSEFARTLVTDFPIQGILDHLVRRVVDILPIEAAGVSLMSPTADPEFIAASDESATRYEHLQVELGEGPCIAAYETDGPILIPDLTENERFPKYAERAMAEGLVAVFTFPLRHDRRSLGVLDLYRTTPGALEEEDIAAARTLADVATAYLLNAEARQAKTDFVATVSHELRTPMTIITGFIELLQDGVTGPLNHDQEMFVKAIARNSDRLTGLANDLLTLTSVERGAINRQQVPVDLGQVISRVQATMAPLIAARHLDVTFEIPTTPVTVRGDSHELESLVTNLLSNAIKFTQDGGWVRCALSTDAQQASVEVSDNGLGIPEDEQGHLFSRFFRSSTAHQHAIQGSGLGLTIVDSIVKRHGGDISLASKHLAGSAFTVRLPLTPT
jgi:signal transduction histidine kinase